MQANISDLHMHISLMRQEKRLVLWQCTGKNATKGASGRKVWEQTDRLVTPRQSCHAGAWGSWMDTVIPAVVLRGRPP